MVPSHEEEQIRHLIDSLSNGPWGEHHQEVVYELIKIGAPAINPLIVAIRTQVFEGSVLRTILRIFTHIEEVRLLKNPNADMRSVALTVLGKIGSPRTIDPLIAMLQDEEADVRGEATKALEKIGDVRALQPITLLVNDTDPLVRCYVLYAITTLGKATVFEHIVNALRDPSPRVRRAAILSLRKFDDTQVFDLLVEALNDATDYVVTEAVDALVELNDKRTLPHLLRLQQKYASFPDDHSMKLAIAEALQHSR